VSQREANGTAFDGTGRSKANGTAEDFNWMLRVIVRSVALPGHPDWDK
jgi:hypothetical protein